MTSSIAFVFPGQGSQALGMLAEHAEAQPLIQQTFAEASEALGYDLWSVTQGDETKLNQTDTTQPAILTASIALWRLWQAQGGAKPAQVAGHSWANIPRWSLPRRCLLRRPCAWCSVVVS